MEINPWYISGFVDGEGSFLVSFSKRPLLALGIEVRPSFTVSQHERNKDVVYQLQCFFDSGSVRYNTRDHTYKFEVRSLSELIEKIIPHFEAYPLRTSKQKDFESLCHVCNRMLEKEHLTQKGIQEIIRSSYLMNNLGARRYAMSDLLRMVRR